MPQYIEEEAFELSKYDSTHVVTIDTNYIPFYSVLTWSCLWAKRLYLTYMYSCVDQCPVIFLDHFASSDLRMYSYD